MTDAAAIDDRTCTEYEVKEVEKANAAGKQPVVFVHGLWLLPNSWDRWREVFEEAGYATAAPGWPDDPQTTEEAKAHPEVFANKSIGQIADHYQEVIEALDKKPAIIGHSFGGLLTEILAGRGLAAVSVPISPAPFRGVLPLPYSALKSGSPVLRNPANRSRAVPLTYDQFKYGFANMLDDDEAKELYEKYSVAGPGKVLFQAASANLNPWTENKVDTKNPERGPMLILAGEKDHTVRTRSPTRRSGVLSPPAEPAGARGRDVGGLAIRCDQGDTMTIRDEGPSASGGGRHLDFRPGMAMWWEITRSTEDTSGELFEATNWIEPGMAAPPVHVHPTAEESYEVVEGAIEVFMDGSWSRVGPGEKATVPAGKPHSVRPAGDGTTRIVNIHQPAQNHEAFFRDMHRLIEQGKIKRLPPGDPRSAIYVGMLFARYPDEIRSIKPPQAVFKALALVGRALRFS